MSITPNTPSETEAWLESLGSKFVEVHVLIGGKWLNERHIADPETLATTVSMTLDRLGGRFAVWQDLSGSGWWLFNKVWTQKSKWYVSREAAEMVAMHSRG